MGASLASRARLACAELEPGRGNERARYVLMAMALTAKDTDPEPCYFGGWQRLAMELGFKPHPTTARFDATAEQAVMRAIRTLTTRGLIEANPAYDRRFKRRYRLILPGPALAPKSVARRGADISAT